MVLIGVSNLKFAEEIFQVFPHNTAYCEWKLLPEGDFDAI